MSLAEAQRQYEELCAIGGGVVCNGCNDRDRSDDTAKRFKSKFDVLAACQTSISKAAPPAFRDRLGDWEAVSSHLNGFQDVKYAAEQCVRALGKSRDELKERVLSSEG